MRYLIILLSLLHFSSYGQDTDSLSAEYKRLLSLRSSRPVIGVEYELGAANNQISFQSIADFRSKSFLEDSYKEELLSNISKPLGFGYWQTYTFSWDKPSFTILGQYIPGRKFSIRNEFISSASVSEDGVALGLFGNSRFAGETADLSNSEYQSWWYTSLDYEYEFVADSINYWANAAIVIGHSYESYKVNTANIFTEADGEFIDADLDYTFRSTNNDNDIPFRGLGFSTGFKGMFPIAEKYQLIGEVQNLGLIYWSNGEEAKVDSTFRFTGLTFDNLFEINDSLTQSERDKITNGLYSSDAASFATLLPFQLKAEGRYKADVWYIKSFYAQVDYRYLPAYKPRYGIGALASITDKHNIDLGIKYGGFNTLTLPVNYKLKLKKWQIALGSSNILALPLPSNTMGTAIYGGVFYSL